MTKRVRIQDDDDDEPTPRPRRRFARDYEKPTPRRQQEEPRRIVRDAADDPPRRQSVHGDSDRLGGNFILAKADGGYRNGAGRPTGRPNVVTSTLKRAIMLAAEDVGEDGEGKDGLQGYLRRLALQEPQAFTSLLRRILPVQVKADVDPQSALGQILDATRARLAQERMNDAKLIEGSDWKREYRR